MRSLYQTLRPPRAQVAVDVPADLARAQQATESSAAVAEERRAGVVAPAFAPLHGYATDAITRDRRFRAAEAFRACGVLRTAYARDALARIQHSMPQRADALTTPQRDALRVPRL